METDLHLHLHLQMMLLLNCLDGWWRDLNDCLATGNLAKLRELGIGRDMAIAQLR